MAINQFMAGDNFANLTNVSALTPLPVTGAGATAATPSNVVTAGSATPTVTSVPSSATTGPLLAASAARRGASIANDSTAILYVLMGAGTASATNYTVALAAKGTVATYYEIPFNYVGVINGVWATANGFAMVTSYAA